MPRDLLGPLGGVLRETREKSSSTQLDIAARARVSQQVVSRLELGKRWPEIGPDRLVAAYAKECGVEPLTLWELALVAASTQKAPHRQKAAGG